MGISAIWWFPKIGGPPMDFPLSTIHFDQFGVDLPFQKPPLGARESSPEASNISQEMIGWHTEIHGFFYGLNI